MGRPKVASLLGKDASMFAALLGKDVQGGPRGRGKFFVDIKFTVLFQYRPRLLLNRNFQIVVIKNFSTTTWATLYTSMRKGLNSFVEQNS